ncbi:coiled-coil domain-containing protein 167 isoform 3-T3 [Guaruba guarouba]
MVRRARRSKGSDLQFISHYAETSTKQEDTGAGWLLGNLMRRHKEMTSVFLHGNMLLSNLVQIDGLEEKLARCRQTVEEVDLKLRREKLSPEGRKSLERERNLLMTKADNYGMLL